MMAAKRGKTQLPHRKRRRWPWVLGAALVVAGLLFCGGVAWGGASVLLTPHHGITTSAGTVQSVGDGRIVLQKSATTLRVGTYGLSWEGGSATVGPTISSDSTTVTRPLSDVVGSLEAGTAVQLNPDIWTGDPKSSLGIDYSEVSVSGELGPMPAWQVPGDGTTWVLFVHGIDGVLQGGLRPLVTLNSLQLPTLLITYRNDVDAPKSPNGLIALGDTEWRDLDSAAEYAVSQGATKFILFGDSMGGSIVTRFVHESQYADDVVALVLDSPVLDWAGVLQGQADRFSLSPLGWPLKAVVSVRGGIDLAALDELDQTDSFTMPILLFQGLSDKLVPVTESQEFASRAAHVTYVPVPDAGHIQSWNVDPEGYEARLSAFLQPFAP